MILQTGGQIMEDVQAQVKEARSVRVYKDGKITEYGAETQEFCRILSAWEEMTSEALPMPAFGVSVDALTREEKKKGTWLEFVFGEERGEELPFERLLIACVPEYRGFNLVRYTQGGYNGRCYYLDLRDKDMRQLCSCLNHL